jgi:N,N'-diacetyllegionaminate synthase
VRIVAEAAEGYGGEWGKELALVDLAAAAGADAVKFQLLHPDELLTADHPLYGLVEDLQLPPERWRAVAERCVELGIELYLDVFGRRGLELAERFGAGAVKVHSSDMLNEALLADVAASSLPEALLSAGGTTLEEVEVAAEALAGKRITVVHGFQAYPTPVAENRLWRLAGLRDAFPEAGIGFADHTGGEEPSALWLPALALALGATYLEKHITVARVLRDPDHQSALAPDGFAGFVANMRLAAAALGAPGEGTEMGEAERGYRLRMKKHVVATRDLAAGTALGAAELALKRAPDPPPEALLRLGEALGAVLAADVRANAPLTRGDLR